MVLSSQVWCCHGCRDCLLNLAKVLVPGHISLGVTGCGLSLPRVESKGFDPAWWLPRGWWGPMRKAQC